MSLRAQLALPLMAPLPPLCDQCDIHQACLSELAKLGEVPTLDPVFGGERLIVELLDSPQKEPLLAGKWKPPNSLRTFSLLNVYVDGTACFESIRASLDWSPKPFTASERESLCQQLVISCLERDVNLFLLAANIARPGSLCAVEGFSFIDGEDAGGTKAFFAEDLFRAVSAATETGWPKLLSPTLQKSWFWLTKSGAVVEGTGVGRLGRALSALSHLTADSLSRGSSIDLFWVLLALEALYTRGNVGLKEQLLAKTEVILGPRTENKKLFGAVYDFRSRLIHGDVDIPARFTEFDAGEKVEKFHSEIYDHESIALAVLLGTLQWMVEHECHELAFKYALERRPHDGEDAT